MINHGRWAHGQQLPHASNSSCDDDDHDMSINSTNSFTNRPSNQYSTSAGSGDHSESHLWNQVLLGSVGNSEGMQQISSEKSFMRSTLMFDPAFDYLKKLEGGWELTTSNSSSAGLLEKQQQQQQQLINIRGGYNNDDSAGGEGDMAGDHSERLIIRSSNLTDLVSNWSIAPPNYPQQQQQQQQQHLHNNIGGPIMNIPNSVSSDLVSSSPHIFKHEAVNPAGGSPKYSFPPPSPAFHSYGDQDDDEVLDHALQQQNENGGFTSTTTLAASGGLANQIGPVNIIGLKNRGLLMEDTPPACSSWSNIIPNSALPRNVSAVDLISFSPVLLNKQPALILMDQLRGSGSGSSSSSCQLGNNKAGVHYHHLQPSSSSSSSSYRKGGPAPCHRHERKKKTSSSSTDHHDSDNTPLFKKPKHHHTSTTTTTTSPHIIIKQSQAAPKVVVKVGDKITALQQIVSPFGKTDTASVLLEAIKYIRFLQEQVQLLSDPYLKSTANKDHGSWPASVERKEKAHPKHDLRGRGLCLVPISCTPQAYRENTGPDYWTPPFRGCLYR